MTAASSSTSVCSSHSSDSMSRWFVGSSSSSRSGDAASARASEPRVSWPPENVFSGRSRAASANPSPCTTALARARQPEPPGGALAAGGIEARADVGVAGVDRLVALAHLLLEPAQLLLELERLARAAQHVLAQRDVLLAGRALVVERDPRALREHELAAVDR